MIGRLSVFVLWLAVSTAFAANTRSWVSSTGNDNNPCTRTSPCATFAGALANTISRGEIDVVDPGDYGGFDFTISQAVTINGGGIGQITGPVTISGGAVVTLRNLSFHGGGVVITGGLQVSITNTTIEDTMDGVYVDPPAAAPTVVTIRNTTITDTNGAITVQSGTVTVDSCLLANNGNGVFTLAGTVWLSNTTITANGSGLSSNALNGGTIISYVNNRIFGNGTNGVPTQSVFQK